METYTHSGQSSKFNGQACESFLERFGACVARTLCGLLLVSGPACSALTRHPCVALSSSRPL